MKWGSFAGGAAKGAVAGMGAVQGLMTAADEAKTREQNRQQSATKMIWEKEQHDQIKKYYDDLYGAMIGNPEVLDRWWKQLGTQGPPVSGGPVMAQTPITTSSSSLGASGGLASY